MREVSGGRTTDGAIGILMLDTVFPRIPGDVGNASTYPFPVTFRIVKGATVQRVVKEADPALLAPFIEAAQELEREGVRAISTSCGFLAMFHQELVNAVKIPVLTSSLLQVPLVASLIGSNQKVGILTARAESLGPRHFRAVGIEDYPVVVQGMEGAREFTEVFIEGKTTLDVEKIKAEMVEAAVMLVQNHPEVGGIVLECTNMPPYAKAVQEAVALPVFDITTLIKYTYSALSRQEFSGGT